MLSELDVTYKGIIMMLNEDQLELFVVLQYDDKALETRISNFHLHYVTNCTTIPRLNKSYINLRHSHLQGIPSV